ncbi:hypothetical protein EMCRGX_G027887 [Ephydatia muelleri]
MLTESRRQYFKTGVIAERGYKEYGYEDFDDNTSLLNEVSTSHKEIYSALSSNEEPTREAIKGNRDKMENDQYSRTT